MSNAAVHLIEIRIRELTQLFNSMDPAPFHHKDLDPDAEEFIVGWALEHPRDAEFEIVIHLEMRPAEGDPGELTREAIHNYFAYRAEQAQREFRLLMQRGRTSLLIGLAFLASCLLLADALAKNDGGTFVSIMRESLTIGGWVAMWRPLQIFLYDWWPLRRRRHIYEKLGRAKVRVLS
ncbi:MAG: hypothetical protein Q8K18_01965 [Burkholderiales bacterium]|nr:hypothetical protein [Burkholderiales bacterium]